MAPVRQRPGGFDRVLVDAPCSGTGTLSGNPEIKWRLSADDITRLAELQFILMESGGSAVANGGRLVYSTCSIEREENEDVVRRFLEHNSTFQVIEPRAPAGLITIDRFVRTFPHRDGTDGFFAAVLERVFDTHSGETIMRRLLLSVLPGFLAATVDCRFFVPLSRTRTREGRSDARLKS